MNAFVQYNIFVGHYGMSERCIPIDARDDNDAEHIFSVVVETSAPGVVATLTRTTLSFPGGKRATLTEKIMSIVCGEIPF